MPTTYDLRSAPLGTLLDTLRAADVVLARAVCLPEDPGGWRTHHVARLEQIVREHEREIERRDRVAGRVLDLMRPNFG